MSGSKVHEMILQDFNAVCFWFTTKNRFIWVFCSWLGLALYITRSPGDFMYLHYSIQTCVKYDFFTCEKLVRLDKFNPKPAYSLRNSFWLISWLVGQPSHRLEDFENVTSTVWLYSCTVMIIGWHTSELH